MCTAITLKTSENHHLVGRNFDIHPMNDLSVALVPREFEYVNRVTNEEMKTKYAVLGMGLFYENHILFCDGVNEKGLSCLMLQLSKFSTWSHKIRKDKVNIAPYDVAFWVLSNFSTRALAFALSVIVLKITLLFTVNLIIFLMIGSFKGLEATSSTPET